MARTDDDDRGPRTASGRIIDQAKQEMFLARQAYRQAQIDGHVSWAVRKELASSLAAYYDALWEYVDENQQVKQAWEDTGLDRIPELADQTVSVTVAGAGRGSNGRQGTRNKLAAQDPGKLVEMSKQLDYFSNQLGFGEPVESGRPFGRIGGEDKWEDVDDE